MNINFSELDSVFEKAIDNTEQIIGSDFKEISYFETRRKLYDINRQLIADINNALIVIEKRSVSEIVSSINNEIGVTWFFYLSLILSKIFIPKIFFLIAYTRVAPFGISDNYNAYLKKVTDELYDFDELCIWYPYKSDQQKKHIAEKHKDKIFAAEADCRKNIHLEKIGIIRIVHVLNWTELIFAMRKKIKRDAAYV